MKTVLLVIESESLATLVTKDLQRDHKVLLCHDAITAGQLIRHRPDALVLQMELPGVDGLTFLEQLPWRPPVILTLAVNYLPYTAQRLYDLGVSHFVRTPCTLAAVTVRLRDMLRDWNNSNIDPQSIVASHLAEQGIDSEHDGGRQLRIGIPLYAQDQTQKLKYELYPAIAEICGTTHGAVEHAMRRTILGGWHQRDSQWEEYFSGRKKCPSNKVFLSTLAKKIC